MTKGETTTKLKRKAVESQLTVLSVVSKYSAALEMTGEKVNHYGIRNGQPCCSSTQVRYDATHPPSSTA